jgi:hypothetical protein
MDATGLVMVALGSGILLSLAAAIARDGTRSKKSRTIPALDKNWNRINVRADARSEGPQA